MNTWIIIDTNINQIIDTVFNHSNCSQDVADDERMNYPFNEIHAILDNEGTRELSELENYQPDYIAKTEHLYLAAIECGFLNADTLETYEDLI